MTPERKPCLNCGQGAMKVFHKVAAVPSNSCILLSSREEAVNYPKGDVHLGFCEKCGFVSNTAFDPSLTEYSSRYEETQGFSATFNQFQKGLVERLIDRYHLHGKTVLEIGCGKGEFLMLFAELGGNRGVGFDPSYIPSRNQSSATDQVTFIKDFFSEKYSDVQADFIACKMTLEHIHATGAFLGMVQKTIGQNSDTIVFFQVPESRRILGNCAFEDIYYEHCSYFSSYSLVWLFENAGFEVLNVGLEYGGQYLTIEARPAKETSVPSRLFRQEMTQLQQLVAEFPKTFRQKVDFWRQKMDAAYMAGKKVVLWGSGSKGVAFLTTTGVSQHLKYAIDINPYRHGYFMPGTGHEIVSPEFLKEYQPDMVIVMNEIYVDEISRQLDSMGLSPDVVSI